MKEIITFEPPDTVVVTFRGQVDPVEIEGLFKKWETFKSPDNNYKLLVDLPDLEDIPPKSREILREGGRKFHMKKIAVIGASRKIHILAGLISKMVPNIDALKCVKNRTQARPW
ncbi:STAS/SEC14 domain-containing protein [candidate division WOR-3 bacterium]|nr:STAS/SEC14 domain-containing protein [candidate division WOR-3 bacterium]